MPVLTQTTANRWTEARQMWQEGALIEDISTAYSLSETAMRTRIQKMRRKWRWFPSRKGWTTVLDPLTGKADHLAPPRRGRSALNRPSTCPLAFP